MHDLLDGSLIGVLDNGFKFFRIFPASAIIFSISFTWLVPLIITSVSTDNLPFPPLKKRGRGIPFINEARLTYPPHTPPCQGVRAIPGSACRWHPTPEPCNSQESPDPTHSGPFPQKGLHFRSSLFSKIIKLSIPFQNSSQDKNQTAKYRSWISRFSRSSFALPSN